MISIETHVAYNMLIYFMTEKYLVAMQTKMFHDWN